METQNVTLALPRSLLRKAKILAVERHTSLSGLLTQALTDLVGGADAYEEARRSALGALEHPPNLGTGGRATWTRDELHERR